MELRQLEYFVGIVKNGSFTAAAKQLYVSQSALSKSVKKLEEELDTPLLFQAGQHTAPTEAGALLYEKAVLLLAEAARTRELVSSEIKNKQGRVRIATSCKRSFLPRVGDLLARFAAQYPNIFLDVNEASPEYIKDNLMHGSVDVGVIVEPLDNALPGLESVVLAQGDYRVVVCKDSPLAQRESVRYADLAGERWIMYRPTFRIAQMVQKGCEAAGFSPRVVLTATQTEFMLSLVSRGFGITVQAWPEAEWAGLTPSWDNVVALPLEDIQSQFAVKVITPQNGYTPPAVRTFVEFAVSQPF